MKVLTKVVIPTAILTGLALAVAPDHEQTVQTAQASTAPSIDGVDLAREYATLRGLTDCVHPSAAFSTDADVVLTVAVDEQLQPTTTRIVPVTLDAALRSSDHSRANLIACQVGE